MLNKVLELLESEKIFDKIGMKKAQELILNMIHMSYNYDCNPGEILEGIGKRVGICFYCLEPKNQDDMDDGGLCHECKIQLGGGFPDREQSAK